MERVNSGTTDDSPFASILTTPIDEDVRLQLYQSQKLGLGIEERLLGLSNRKEGGDVRDSGSAMYVGSREGRVGRGGAVSEMEFRKELEKKLLTLDPTFPTKTSIPLAIPLISTDNSVAINHSTPEFGFNSENILNQPALAPPSEFSTAGSTPDLGPRSASIYNLPNGAIVVETGSQHRLPSESEDVNETVCPIDSLPGSPSHSFVSQIPGILDRTPGDVDLVLKASLNLKSSSQSSESLDPALDVSNDSLSQYDFSALPFADTSDESSAFLLVGIQSINLASVQLSSLSKVLLPLVLRVVLFLPWCVIVGGTIVMYPQHLEFIAFGPGYVKSPKGIHRFAHWADTGMQHVWIFMGFLASVWWIYPNLGLMVIGGVVAQTVNAWQDFQVDRSIPLGEDDRQTMYLVGKQYGMPDELMGIKKTNEGYLISRLDRSRVELEGENEDER